MTVEKNLTSLLKRLDSGEIGFCDYNWGGADVLITSVMPEVNTSSFYPDPTFVVTQHAKELSWLFDEISDLFIGTVWRNFDYKYEFYGRLATAAIETMNRNKSVNAKDLLIGVVHEAIAMARELEEQAL